MLSMGDDITSNGTAIINCATKTSKKNAHV